MNTTPTVVSLSYELGAIGYEEARPDRAVVIGSGTGDLYWFNPWNMSFIKNQTIEQWAYNCVVQRFHLHRNRWHSPSLRLQRSIASVREQQDLSEFQPSSQVSIYEQQSNSHGHHTRQCIGHCSRHDFSHTVHCSGE